MSESASNTTTGEITTTATASAPARGRVRDATGAAAAANGTTNSTRRSRSRSRLRPPKIAGIRLKGMVKNGWNSMRKLGSRNTVSTSSSSDLASRTSTDHGSIALNSEADDSSSGSISYNKNNNFLTMESLLNTTSKTATATSVVSQSALELVVLLMDPISRRFELLQLEFDSSKAKVSDLLTQIPLSVTEPKLQEQQFVGVLDHRGQLEEGSTRLLQAFGSSAENQSGIPSQTSNATQKLVLVAKPKGLSTKETMRLAKPILTFTQVDKMVSPQESQHEYHFEVGLIVFLTLLSTSMASFTSF
jgi:hypothetical protein